MDGQTLHYGWSNVALSISNYPSVSQSSQRPLNGGLLYHIFFYKQAVKRKYWYSNLCRALQTERY